MNILFLDAYFEPEQIAFTHLEHDLLDRLVEEGNEIQVVCPIPTRGISKEIAEAYKRKRQESLYGGHVNVTRFAAPQEGRNPLLRCFRYFWCNLRTYQIGKREKGIDLVFCNSTPPTQGWIAGKVACRIKAPLVYSLQDIFPDSLVTTGLSNKNSLFWRIGRKLEDKTYEGCNRIIVITDAMKQNLLEKNVKKEIDVISNWIDTDQIKPVNREENRLFDELKIDRSKYIVLYAGNFGEAQGAEIILEVAERFQNEDGLSFVIFGGGSGYDAVAEKACKMKNVFIHPLMPMDRVSEVYSMGDVALITCKKGTGKSGMPSKLWSIMACDKPIIASFDLDSELASLLNSTMTGICVQPEDVEALLSAINSMRKNHNCYKSMRNIALRIASKEQCTAQYISIFRSLSRS